MNQINIPEANKGLGKGLYAEFETNHGNWTIKLEDERTPKTVENFIGLATGQKQYVDPKLGDKSNLPFYDGTVFHRVIKKFMIQGGDRLGLGTGGPGYRFEDEFHPELKHTTAGVLSMANSGPNTNGSQFFITLVPCEWLDGKHAVFGRVVAGMDIVERIGAIETGQQDRPREECKIIKLNIFKEL